MTERRRWTSTPAISYGVAFGVLAGGMMILAIGRRDQWQDEASTVLEITIMTTPACLAVSYVRQFISN